MRCKKISSQNIKWPTVIRLVVTRLKEESASTALTVARPISAATPASTKCL